MITVQFVEKPVKPAIDRVVIEMSGEEASALRAIVGNIAGHGPLRTVTGALYHTLAPVDGGSLTSPLQHYVLRPMEVKA